MNKDEIVKTLLRHKAVAVIRLADASKLVKVAEALYKGGIYSIEITMTVPDAIKGH